MKQMERKTDHIYYIRTHRGSLRMWDPRTHWAVEAYMLFWTNEREAGVWDFKGKVGNSQVDGNEQTCGEQILEF